MAKLNNALQVLGALSFELTVPTAKTFLRRFLKAALPGDMPADTRLECLSSYLAELMLPEYGTLQFLPSQVGQKSPCCQLHDTSARAADVSSFFLNTAPIACCVIDISVSLACRPCEMSQSCLSCRLQRQLCCLPISP